MRIEHTESMSRFANRVHAERRDRRELAELERALHRDAARWRRGDTAFIAVLLGFAVACWIGVFSGVSWLIGGG